MVDAALDPTAVVDADLRLLAYNRAYAELAGIRERELRSQDRRGMCHEVFGLETCAQDGCPALRALKTDRPVRLHQVRALKRELSLVLSAAPLLDGAEPGRYVVETYRDVTADTRLQERFKVLLRKEREQNESLQQEVERRTAELSEARFHLIQLEKMSALGLLVAGVAHELNNPINFIYGNVTFAESHLRGMLDLIERLKGLPLEADHREALEAALREKEYDYVRGDIDELFGAIREGTQRVVRIVGDLRTFSSAGREGELSLFDLSEGLSTTSRLVRPEAKKRNITLVTEFATLPPVVCVAPKINQVAMNLLVNAIHATPNGGKVYMRTRADGPHGVVIEVQDEGGGVPAEIISKIFDPFFTTKDVGEGTGLGLSISLGIVKSHGGELTVDSPGGQGATFRVRLPFTPPEVSTSLEL